MTNKTNPKLKGALVTFIVLQLIYLFSFLATFPDSLENALAFHSSTADMAASWLSTLTMLAYCILCLVSVIQLVLRKSGFLLWFQISGLVALVGNFAVYVVRQVSGELYTYSSSRGAGYYWALFIGALFWTVIWCMYFARSSRVFSYMGENPAYLKTALFTKNVQPPPPWVEPVIQYPPAGYPPPNPQVHPGQPGYPPYGQQPHYGAPPQPGYPAPPQPPVQQPYPQPPAQQAAQPPAPPQQPVQQPAQPQAAPPPPSQDPQ